MDPEKKNEKSDEAAKQPTAVPKDEKPKPEDAAPTRHPDLDDFDKIAEESLREKFYGL